MVKFTPLVLAVITITLYSEKCYSLESASSESDSSSRYNTVSFVVDDDNEIAVEKSRRVTRQAYQGQANQYPAVPSGSPNGYEYPHKHLQWNQNPYLYQQWRPNSNQSNGSSSNNNYGTTRQPGPNLEAFKPNLVFGGEQSHGYYNQSQHNPQGNGYNPNNPYGPNYQSVYPSHQGHQPTNYSGGWPQANNTNSYPNTNGYGPNNPYESNNGYATQRPNYNSTPPGFKPANNYIPSGRPPYIQPRQNSSTYPGYPSYNQNTTHRNPVTYDGPTNRPGQNMYGHYNNTSWGGTTLNNTQRPYDSPNGQYPNFYPNNSGSAGNSRNPYNPSQGQTPLAGYPGVGPTPPPIYPLKHFQYPGYPDPIKYNPNPSPYGGPNPWPSSDHHDPTKVSPQHYNAY